MLTRKIATTVCACTATSSTRTTSVWCLSRWAWTSERSWRSTDEMWASMWPPFAPTPIRCCWPYDWCVSVTSCMPTSNRIISSLMRVRSPSNCRISDRPAASKRTNPRPTSFRVFIVPPKSVSQKTPSYLSLCVCLHSCFSLFVYDFNFDFCFLFDAVWSQLATHSQTHGETMPQTHWPQERLMRERERKKTRHFSRILKHGKERGQSSQSYFITYVNNFFYTEIRKILDLMAMLTTLYVKSVHKIFSTPLKFPIIVVSPWCEKLTLCDWCCLAGGYEFICKTGVSCVR